MAICMSIVPRDIHSIGIYHIQGGLRIFRSIGTQPSYQYMGRNVFTPYVQTDCATHNECMSEVRALFDRIKIGTYLYTIAIQIHIAK